MKKKKDLNKLTIEELEKEVEIAKKKINIVKKDSKHPYIIGGDYLIRTVTMIYTGRLVNVYDKELVITQASWIPETERWSQSVANGKFKEVEPYPQEKEIIIGRGAILDMTQIDFKLPNKQK